MPRSFYYDPDADKLYTFDDPASEAAERQKNPRLVPYDDYVRAKKPSMPTDFLTPDPSKQPALPSSGPGGHQPIWGGLVPNDKVGQRLTNAGLRLGSHVLGMAGGGALPGAKLPGTAGIALALADSGRAYYEDPTTANTVGEAIGTLLSGPAGRASSMLGKAFPSASIMDRARRMLGNAGIAGIDANAISMGRRVADPKEQPLGAADQLLVGSMGAIPGFFSGAELPAQIKLRRAIGKEFGEDFTPQMAQQMQPQKGLAAIAERLKQKPEDVRVNLQKELAALKGENRDLDLQKFQQKSVMGKVKNQTASNIRDEQAQLRKQQIDLQTEKQNAPRSERRELNQEIGEVKKELEGKSAESYYNTKGAQPDSNATAKSVADDTRPADFNEVVGQTPAQPEAPKALRLSPEEVAAYERNKAIAADPKKPLDARKRAETYVAQLELKSAMQHSAAIDAAQPPAPSPAQAASAPAPQLNGVEAPMAKKLANMAKIERLKAEMQQYSQPEAALPGNLSNMERENYIKFAQGAGAPENEYQLVDSLYKSDPGTVRAFAKVHGHAQTGDVLAAQFIKNSVSERGDFSKGPAEWTTHGLGDKLREAFGTDDAGKERYKNFVDIYHAMNEIAQKGTGKERLMSFTKEAFILTVPMRILGPHIGISPNMAYGAGAGLAAAHVGWETLVDGINKYPKFREAMIDLATKHATPQTIAMMPQLVQWLKKNASFTVQPTYTEQQEKDMNEFDNH